ncbi:MAG: hypothetical protein ABIQ27_14225 [Flavobacterium sp.]|uniref:hypothetical protein n=1 Tax=Flavobacterium sp. TaxID=239 RepID=UPI0032666B53
MLLFLPFLFSCDGGNINYNNPNLPNYPVNLSINMSLPQYSNLQFPSNHIVDYTQGIAGIVVFNTGSSYQAYDLACPNQLFGSACSSAMTINGIEAKCNCNLSEATYSLFSGQSQGQPYQMKPYQVQISGGNLIIYNN